MAKFLTEKTVIKRKNPETGEMEEVEHSKVHRIKIKPDDEFYMVYLKYMAPYYDLNYADDIKVLGKLCEWAEFEKGVVYVTAGRRQEIRETLGIHNSNISTSLKRLKDKNHISGSNGEFIINPTIFWKGSKAARMEMLRKESIQVKFNFELEQDIKPITGLNQNSDYDV